MCWNVDCSTVFANCTIDESICPPFVVTSPAVCASPMPDYPLANFVCTTDAFWLLRETFQLAQATVADFVDFVLILGDLILSLGSALNVLATVEVQGDLDLASTAVIFFSNFTFATQNASSANTAVLWTVPRINVTNSANLNGTLVVMLTKDNLDQLQAVQAQNANSSATATFPSISPVPLSSPVSNPSANPIAIPSTSPASAQSSPTSTPTPESAPSSSAAANSGSSMSSSSGSSAALIESGQMNDHSSTTVVTPPGECRTATATPYTTQNGDRSTLNALFSVSTENCSKNASKIWWIVLSSSVGGVVLITVLLVVAYYKSPMFKRLVAPFNRPRVDHASKVPLVSPSIPSFESKVSQANLQTVPSEESS